MSGSSRRADVFLDLDEDPREELARLGDEKTTLATSLRHLRLTLEIKCEGLDAEQMARRAVPPSTMSLLGLVRHLADIEQGAFRVEMAGQKVELHYTSPTNRDGDFDDAVADPELVAEAWATWRDEVAFAEQFVEAADDLGMTGISSWDGSPVSLREAMVGMIEEYARHLGHVDLLRECIDGRLGQ
jgi:Protein of unknown function (DUF664)